MFIRVHPWSWLINKMKKELGIFTLLVLLCGVTAAINPRFLSATNLTNMANIIGLYGVFSLGLGLVIITGGIDLSVGSMFALVPLVWWWGNKAGIAAD